MVSEINSALDGGENKHLVAVIAKFHRVLEFPVFQEQTKSPLFRGKATQDRNIDRPVVKAIREVPRSRLARVHVAGTALCGGESGLQHRMGTRLA